jgi:hypothetical protein
MRVLRALLARKAFAHANQFDVHLDRGRPGVSAHIRKRRDNDLIVVESGGAAAAFKNALQMRFGSGEVPNSNSQTSLTRQFNRGMNGFRQRAVRLDLGSVVPMRQAPREA